MSRSDLASPPDNPSGRSIHSYPKVFAIGHPAIAELFIGPVLVEEKVDGSQFNFQYTDHYGLRMRSKGAEVFTNERHNMFSLAVDAINQELLPLLHPGWTYRAEYLMKPKHNTLAYSRVPKYNLILFDVSIGDNVFLSRKEKEAEAARLGMEIVPVIYEGEITNAEQLKELLQRESILGGQSIEGMVVKNYAQFGPDKKVQMGKYVREDFKEMNSKAWKSDPDKRTEDIVEKLGQLYRSEARWEKAVYHLRDAGKLEQSPRDIGKLITEVKDDILKEEEQQIKDALYAWAKGKILRISTAGLPEWYKGRLLAEAFKDKPEVYEQKASEVLAADPDTLDGWCCPLAQETNGAQHKMGCYVQLSAPRRDETFEVVEEEWRKCLQCGRENSRETWKKNEDKCPNCNNLYEKECMNNV